ncbi:MAG: hypothetical protein CSA38_03275 [Flavobacteriales bacterium]|nr:MAG: hypothetical protein CSA38_03275 [Flavobacteriales bacterium]
MKSRNIEHLENYLIYNYEKLDQFNLKILTKRLKFLKRKAKDRFFREQRRLNPNFGQFTTEKEFKALVLKKSNQDVQKELQLLNDLDQNPANSILNFVNDSKCNIVLTIKAKDTQYELPVPTKSESTILVKNGDYTIVGVTGEICRKRYFTKKRVDKDLIINL